MKELRSVTITMIIGSRLKLAFLRAGFRATLPAAILTSELERFATELQSLFQTLRGVAKFQTLEEQLHLELKGDGKGYIALNGELLDRAGIGNRLNFSFQFDQVALGESIREIKAAFTLPLVYRGSTRLTHRTVLFWHAGNEQAQSQVAQVREALPCGRPL